MSKAVSRAWLPRATAQFARTVYTELRRAGHKKPDIVRFINEVMDILSQDTSKDTEPSTIAAPTLIDPEAGLPGSDTMHDIVEFELRIRHKDRRQDERLAVVAIDVLVPGWASASARERTHQIVAPMLARGLRAGDLLGQLGPDRYLLVLPRSKDGVRASIQGRIAARLDELAAEFPEETVFELRWTVVGGGAFDPSTAIELLQHCFATTPEVLKPVVVPQARRPAPVRGPQQPPSRDIVLALGGGAARAVSHAGVLQVLTAAGIRPIAAAGCSAGGLVAAMFARGLSPDAISARFCDFSSTPLYREMRTGYANFLREGKNVQRRSRARYFDASSLAFYSDSVLSVLSTQQLFAFVEHFVGSDCDIGSLSLPFSVVATDLVEGRPVKLSHGSLHTALAASCSVPGLFPPQQVGERLFVDGSTVTEVPIWTAHLLGFSAPVLAVYMGRPFHRIEDYKTSTEVATRGNALIHAELVREQLSRAELLLTVPMEDIGWLDFRKAMRIVEIGRTAAESALPRIIARLDRTGQHEDATVDAP